MSIRKLLCPLRRPCGLAGIGPGGMFIRNANACTNNLSDHKPSLDNRSTHHPSPSPERGSNRALDSGPDNGTSSGSYRAARTNAPTPHAGSQLLRRRPRYR